MTLNSVCLAFAALNMVVLGLAVYRRAPDRPVNKLFAVYAFSAALWVTTNLLIMTSLAADMARLWVRAGHIGAALGAVTFVDFAWVFPASLRYQRLRWRVLLFFWGLVGASVAFMPELILDLQVTPGIVEVTYGWPIQLFFVFLVTTLGYGDVILILKWRKARALQRVQIFYVLTGMGLAHGTGIATILAIPLIFATTAASGWGAVGHIFAVGFIAYSIAKHRLMDVGTAIRRWAAYLVTAGVIGFAGLVGIGLLGLTGGGPDRTGQMITVLATAGVLTIIFVAIHSVTRELIEARFGGKDTSFVEALQEASRRIGHALEAEEIYELVVSTAVNTVQATTAWVYVIEKPTGDAVCPAYQDVKAQRPQMDSHQVLSSDHVLIRTAAGEDKPLYREDILRFRPLAEAQPLLAAMEELGVEVVVPLKWEGELTGLLCTGPREGNRMYRWADLELLESLCAQIVLSLRNAELHAQVLTIKELFEMILRRMESGVVAVDEQARVTLFNPAAARMLGIGEHRVLGRSVEQLPAAVRGPLEMAHDHGQVRTEKKAQIARPDGNRVPVTYSISLLTDMRGGYRGAVMVLSDMSVHEALESKRREAERLALMRTISAGMAHEIRNPLVAIRTFTELAPTRLSDPEFQSDFAQVAHDEIDRIDNLVDQLLMLSRPISAARASVDVNDLVQSVLRSLSATAEAKQLELHHACAASLPPALADESRLRQALMNIVLNAVEAAPQAGEVRVTTRSQPLSGDDDNSEIVIEVWNSGTAIAAEDLTHLFEPFYTTKPGGTGLGLAVCQAIMEEHGGSASVQTNIGNGTQFTLTLPLNGEVVSAETGGELQQR